MFNFNLENAENRPNLLIFTQSKEKLKSFPHIYIGMIKPFFESLKLKFNFRFESNVRDFFTLTKAIKPDLILIDSGHESSPNNLPDASELKYLAGSSALAFYTAMDAHTIRISENIQYLNNLNPDVIFSHDFFEMAYPKHLSRKHILILNSFDDVVFTEYHQKKEILCGFYGDGFFTRQAYPWRRKIASKVIPQFPSYHLPRPVGLRDHGITGEAYAKVINRTKICFGCGGIKDLPVRKLFEIPASGSLLMLPNTANLKDIGFIDNENCLFVDEHNVLQKIRYVIDNPDECARITNNGRNFVNTKHSWRNRDHVFQWYNLHLKLKNNQRIIQRGLLNSLKVIDFEAEHLSYPENQVYIWLESASRYIKLEKYEVALSFYNKILWHIEHIPEAVYGVAICNLLLKKENDPIVHRFLKNNSGKLDFNCNKITKIIYKHYIEKTHINAESVKDELKNININEAFFRFSILPYA